MNQVIVGWVGMTASLTGVAIQSLLPQLTRYSFVVFLTASILWLINGLQTSNRPLVCMQVVMMVLNTIAIFRWFTG